MSTETAPESCPFCGAGLNGVPQAGVMVFRCGTMVSPGNTHDEQSEKCRARESGGQIVATIKRLEAEKAFLSESHLAQENKRLVAEMLELRNAIQRDTDAFIRLTRDREEAREQQRLGWERAAENFRAYEKAQDDANNLLARVKRLEEDWSGWPDLQREWFGDKYAAMQPLDAVRARIEDSEARIKRLEEAGSRLRKYLRIAVGPVALGRLGKRIEAAIADWDKAKEAKT